jgi:hypothetical protein
MRLLSKNRACFGWDIAIFDRSRRSLTAPKLSHRTAGSLYTKYLATSPIKWSQFKARSTSYKEEKRKKVKLTGPKKLITVEELLGSQKLVDPKEEEEAARKKRWGKNAKQKSAWFYDNFDIFNF